MTKWRSVTTRSVGGGRWCGSQFKHETGEGTSDSTGKIGALAPIQIEGAQLLEGGKGRGSTTNWPWSRVWRNPGECTPWLKVEAGGGCDFAGGQKQQADASVIRSVDVAPVPVSDCPPEEQHEPLQQQPLAPQQRPRQNGLRFPFGQ